MTDQDAQDYVKNSKAMIIILMQVQGRSASFTVVKDQRHTHRDPEPSSFLSNDEESATYQRRLDERQKRKNSRKK